PPCYFFFSLLRRPPCPTLLPYTTLFRSLPPYGWRANPIVDSARWLGFDLFCAFQYVYLMHLMFFLSGLFVWPSLSRKGGRRFISSEEHTSELQSRSDLVCRLLLEKKKKK